MAAKIRPALIHSFITTFEIYLFYGSISDSYEIGRRDYGRSRRVARWIIWAYVFRPGARDGIF